MEITEFASKYNLNKDNLIAIEPEIIFKIIKLFEDKIIDTECLHPDYLRYLGYYYETIEKNYPEMKKYYQMAIGKGDSDAMNNLGLYYKQIEKNYDEMKKYYLMAIDKGNSNTMNNLGYYYQHIETNYDEMKKYYLMAIDKGNSYAMNNLTQFYSNNKINEEDYQIIIKYNLKVDKKKLIEFNINSLIQQLIEGDDTVKEELETYFENKDELTFEEIELIIKYKLKVNNNLKFKNKNKIFIFEMKYQDQENFECPIEIRKPVIGDIITHLPNCGHKFLFNKEFLKMENCPSCKTKI